MACHDEMCRKSVKDEGKGVPTRTRPCITSTCGLQHFRPQELNECAHRTGGSGGGEENEGKGKHSIYVPPGASRTVKRAVACTEKRLSTDMVDCVCAEKHVCGVKAW